MKYCTNNNIINKVIQFSNVDFETIRARIDLKLGIKLIEYILKKSNVFLYWQFVYRGEVFRRG